MATFRRWPFTGKERAHHLVLIWVRNIGSDLVKTVY